MRVSAIISLLSLAVLQVHSHSLLHPLNPFYHQQQPIISDPCFSSSATNDKTKSCMPLIVRPADLPKPTIEPPQKVVEALAAAASAAAAAAPALPVPVLPPIGGPCSCKAALVKPALVPKPAPFTQQIGCQNQQIVTQQHHCNSHLINSGITSTYTNSIPLVPSENGITGVNTAAGCNGVNIANMLSQHQIANYRRNPANIAPADAVSLTLAFNQAKKQCGKSEGQLAFGFRQLPKELPQQRFYSLGGRRKALIPEGNLFDLNGEVVELKKVKCEHTKSLDEEAVEELLDLAMEEQEESVDTHLPLKTVSLGELGYVPAKKNSPLFIDIPAKPIESAVNGAIDAVSGAIQGCKDGFQPGEVITAHVPKMQPILSPPPMPLPEPCEDSLEDRLVPVRPAVAVPVSGSYVGGYQQSASSCASASQSNHHSFVSGY